MRRPSVRIRSAHLFGSSPWESQAQGLRPRFGFVPPLQGGILDHAAFPGLRCAPPWAIFASSLPGGTTGFGRNYDWGSEQRHRSELRHRSERRLLIGTTTLTGSVGEMSGLLQQKRSSDFPGLFVNPEFAKWRKMSA